MTAAQEQFDHIVKHCFHDKLKPLNFRKRQKNLDYNYGIG